MLKNVLSSPYTPAAFFIVACMPTIYLDMFVNKSQYSGYIGLVFMILAGLIILLCGLSLLFKSAWVKVLPFLMFVLLTAGMFLFSVSPNELYCMRWVFILLCVIAIWAAVSFALAIPWRGKNK